MYSYYFINKVKKYFAFKSKISVYLLDRRIRIKFLKMVPEIMSELDSRAKEWTRLIMDYYLAPKLF